MKRFFTGIGSRTTPNDIQTQMARIAKRLALDHWILRSGGATGADDIFEQTYKQFSGQFEIYLPWYRFNSKWSPYHNPPQAALDEALIYHPNPKTIMNNIHVWKLMARNVQQILGADLLQEKSKFVVCWTPDGAERGEDTTSKTGGTGQAIRVASAYQVPIFNLKNPGSFVAVNEFIDSFNQP